MNPPITVIHHSADYDGIFCREIARKFLPDATLIGWDYGQPRIPIPEGQIYVLDLSPDCLEDGNLGNRVIWIDHHKSAIEKFGTSLPGYRIDGVAACRLAWQWFTMVDGNTPRVGAEIGIPIRAAGVLPMVQDYKNREVSEPLAVRLAGEYDIWDKRDPRAELFQHGLRSRDLTNDWGLMLSPNRKMSVSEIEALMDVGHDRDLLNPDGTTDNPVVLGLLDAGRGIQYAQTHQNESIIKEIGFTLLWEGLTFLCCNHARYNSFLFTAGLKPEHDACFGFKWTGTDWSVSLYHAPGKEHHDLSLIAVKYGGGGHPGACGFRADDLPFLS